MALLTCNSAMIIFSIALANPNSSAGIWFTRLFQFCLAWLFAIGMMCAAHASAEPIVSIGARVRGVNLFDRTFARPS